MKKSVKVLLIVGGSLVLIVAAVALSVSPIAKAMVEKHSKEWIGRNVTINNLAINIFNGSLQANGVRLFEANDTDIFVSIDTLYLNTTPYKLLSKTIEVTETRLIAPKVRIVQNGSHFNFSDLFEKSDTIQDTTQVPFPYRIDLFETQLAAGEMIYTDMQLHNTVDLKNIDFLVPAFSVGRGSSKAGLKLNVAEGTLMSDLKLNQEDNTYDLLLQLNHISMAVARPYLDAFLLLGDFSGYLSTNLNVTGSLDHLLHMVISGDASINRLMISNSKGELIVNGNAYARVKKFDLEQMSCLLDSFVVRDTKTAFIRRADGNNFTDLLRPTRQVDTLATSDTPTKPFVLKSEMCRIMAEVMVEDKTLVKPFVYPIKKIDLVANNFDLAGVNRVRGKLVLPENGTLKVDWTGSLSDASNMKLVLGLVSVDAKKFTPYCEEYTAYPITKGTLAFSSETTIRSNQLNSKNVIDIYKFAVGKRMKERKPEYNVPLRTAVYVLTDMESKIKFNIPVEGNMKDPTFKMGKVIWQTVLNLLVKVALAPANFIANALGMNSDNLDYMILGQFQYELTSEQYNQMNDIATILKTKPEMRLKMVQVVDREALYPAMAMLVAKKEFYNATHPDSIDVINTYNLSLLEEIVPNDPGFDKFVTDRLIALQKPTDGLIKDKVRLLYALEQLNEAVDRLMAFRDQQVKNQFFEVLKLPLEAVSVEWMPQTNVASAEKKSVYKLNFSVGGPDGEE